MIKQLRLTKGAFLFATLITFLVCPGFYAAEETLPTPEEIIEKNIEAMGGKEALKKIKNKKLIIGHKVSGLNVVLKVTEYRERPNNYYLSYDGGARYGSNGKIAWTIDKNGARLSKGDEASIALFYAKFDRPDMPYKSMRTEGIEQINGKDCYKVVKTLAIGTEKIVYYDKKSHTIVKTIDYVKNPQPGNNIKHEIYFEGYKKINNILFPYKETHFYDGQLAEEMTYKKIELNIEMPEGIFDIPEAVKAVMDKHNNDRK